MATQVLPSYLTASTVTTVIGGVTQTQVQTVVVSSVLPTQELPSYLSASTFTTTVAGVGTTGTTLVAVPLTYIGPSVSTSPSFGTSSGSEGSTTPASITATQTSTSSSTATPSSSSQSPITSASTSSASVSSSSFSTSISSSTSSNASASSTSSTSPPSTSSAAAGTGGASGLTTGKLIGIIIAAVVALIVIVLLVLLCFYRYRRRRAEYSHPNMSDFVIIDSEGQPRIAGEGSPRPTGEEGDSFLRGSGETADTMHELGPTARLVNNPSPTATERTTGTTVPPEGVVPSALKTPPVSPSPTLGPKLPSPFFHASSSSLFFNPSRGPDQSLTGAAVGVAKRDSASTRGSTASTPSSPANGNAGKLISPRQLMQMDDQWRREPHGTGLGVIGLHHRPSELGERTQTGSALRLPPAAGVDTTTSSRQDLNSTRTMGSHLESPGSEDDERATLLIVHRFNMNDGGRATLAPTDNEASSPSSWRSSLGLNLGNLRLSRLSWFQRMDQRRTHSPESALPTTRSGSPARQMRSVDTRSSLAVPRPVSNLTTSSTGDTLYFDAPSGPSTMSTRSGRDRSREPSNRPVSMPPLPLRAVITPVDGQPSSAPQSPRPDSDNRSDVGSSFNQPALLLLDPASAPASPRFPMPPPPSVPPQMGRLPNEPMDILDTPVPARVAASPFSTMSSRGGPAVPPGLEHLANVHSWRDSSSDMPSSATFGSHSSHAVNVDVPAGSGGDVLEEAPPRPTSNWLQLRAVTIASTIESSRTNRTLGQPYIEDPHDGVQSAAASLHSIPDLLSPLSPMGSGSFSRAPSRQYNSSSLGSNSSQFSRGPSPLGGNSGNGNGNGTSGSSRSQLGHSNSISSEGRRRPRREPGEPPALSPSSSAHFHRARLSAIGGYRTPVTTPQRSPAVEATFAQAGAMNEGTGAIVGRMP